MQVATPTAVLLVDMLKLHTSDALNLCLTSLMHDATIIKLGCRLSDDLEQLHRSYPHMQAFQQAAACLDLSSPWTEYMQKHNEQVLTVYW